MFSRFSRVMGIILKKTKKSHTLLNSLVLNKWYICSSYCIYIFEELIIIFAGPNLLRRYRKGKKAPFIFVEIHFLHKLERTKHVPGIVSTPYFISSLTFTDSLQKNTPPQTLTLSVLTASTRKQSIQSTNSYILSQEQKLVSYLYTNKKSLCSVQNRSLY